MKKRIYEKSEIEVLRFGCDILMDGTSTSVPDTLISDPWGGV